MGRVTNFEKVKEFHRAFNLHMPDGVTIPDPAVVALRMKLIKEEYGELVEEVESFVLSRDKEKLHLPNMAKEMADVLYTVYGMAVEFGIDLDKVFSAVHDSNMSKLNENGVPIYHDNGKVKKSNLYRPPDIKSILKIGD